MNFKLVVANWKMNPSSLDGAEKLAKKIKSKIKGLKKTKLILCPPALYLTSLKKIFSRTKVFLGGQDFFLEQKGSWTGKISAEMLKKNGADFVLIGHSEVRILEDEENVNLKLKEALKNKMNVILCVGEKEHDEEGLFFIEIERQINFALKNISPKSVRNIIMAYEPLWAIGENAKAFIKTEDLQAMVIFIRKTLADKFGIKNFNLIPVLYGGSVNIRNVEQIISGGIDGFLVGRESLEGERFNQLLEIIEKNN